MEGNTIAVIVLVALAALMILISCYCVATGRCRTPDKVSFVNNSGHEVPFLPKSGDTAREEDKHYYHQSMSSEHLQQPVGESLDENIELVDEPHRIEHHSIAARPSPSLLLYSPSLPSNENCDPRTGLPLASVPKGAHKSFDAVKDTAFHFFVDFDRVTSRGSYVRRCMMVSHMAIYIMDVDGNIRRCFTISAISTITIDHSDDKRTLFLSMNPSMNEHDAIFRFDSKRHADQFLIIIQTLHQFHTEGRHCCQASPPPEERSRTFLSSCSSFSSVTPTALQVKDTNDPKGMFRSLRLEHPPGYHLKILALPTRQQVLRLRHKMNKKKGITNNDDHEFKEETSLSAASPLALMELKIDPSSI